MSFISKAQQPNEKLKLVMWPVTVPEQEIKLSLVFSVTCMNHLLTDFYKDCYLISMDWQSNYN